MELVGEPTKALLKKEWYYHKSKYWKFSIILAIFSIFTILFLKALPYLFSEMSFEMPELNANEATSSLLSNIISVSSLIGVILCSDVIAGEREKKTLILLETTTISKPSIIITKFLFRYTIMVIATIVTTFLTYPVIIALFDDGISIKRFILATLLQILSIAISMSIGVISSVIARTQLIAGALGIAVYFAVSIVTSFITLDYKHYDVINIASYLFVKDFTVAEIMINIGLSLAVITTIICIAVILIPRMMEKE